MESPESVKLHDWEPQGEYATWKCRKCGMKTTRHVNIPPPKDFWWWYQSEDGNMHPVNCQEYNIWVTQNT